MGRGSAGWQSGRVSTRRKQQREAKKLRPPVTPPEIVRPAFVDECPVCGAEAFEEGTLGCCGAWVVDCVGSVDGVSTSELEDDDPRWDAVQRHAWYADTGKPAPHESRLERIPCRCESDDEPSTALV